MKRRSILTLITMVPAWLWIALLTSNAVSQQAMDLEGVKTASKAFYEVIAVIDNGGGDGQGVGIYYLRYVRRPP